MLKSMTGFGRSEKVTKERKIVVEMKAVNHRYCDISIRLPKKFNFFEAAIRSLLKEYIGRGKVDIFITYEDYTDKTACVKYNNELAKEYYSMLLQISDNFNLANDVTAVELSKYPDVFVLEEQAMDEEELWTIIEQVIREAAERLVEARITEGSHLKADLNAKLQGMQAQICQIEQRAPEIIKDYKNKITAKVKELLEDTTIDEAVLATELTIFADKICVDEEMVRLKSHIDNMRNTLDTGNNIGRKLDFIAQEMNREANTVLSKANDLEVTNQAIDLKTEIEKIREQIQNIE